MTVAGVNNLQFSSTVFAVIKKPVLSTPANGLKKSNRIVSNNKLTLFFTHTALPPSLHYDIESGKRRALL
jgi:hypothetical protein